MRLDAFGAACFTLLDVFKMNSPGHPCRIGWRKLGGRSSGYAHAVGLRIASVLALFTPKSLRTQVRLEASKSYKRLPVASKECMPLPKAPSNLSLFVTIILPETRQQLHHDGASAHQSSKLRRGCLSILRSEALEFSPENPEILTMVGLMYLRLGETYKAFDFLGNALTHSPRDAKTILAAGSIIQDNQDVDVSPTTPPPTDTARGVYLTAAQALKKATGPYKAARDACVAATATYTKSLYE